MFPGRELWYHDYADAWLAGPLGRFLDYGCGGGAMLQRVHRRCAECWGVDADEAVLPRDLAGVNVRPIRAGERIPFEDGAFDTIAILDVIEHVADERAVLGELARVLAPGGRLLLTTPHKGLLTWLDPGNLKFLFPQLHRFTHRTVLRRADHYEDHFGQARREARGMIADFTIDQNPWHRHYRYDEVRALAPHSLETVSWAVYNPGLRLCCCARIACRVLTRGRYAKDPWPFNVWNHWASRRETVLGDQLVVLFRRTSLEDGRD
jgi:SAM-dependent methyltransferase